MERKITIHKNMESLAEKAILRETQTTVEQRLRNLEYLQNFTNKLKQEGILNKKKK